MAGCGDSDLERSKRLLPLREKAERTEARFKELEARVSEMPPGGALEVEMVKFRDAKAEWDRAKAAFDAASQD